MRALVLLFLSLYVLADEKQVGNLYPQPSFQRVLYSADPYASGYCIDNGQEAEKMDPSTDGYMVYQTCYHGRIDTWFDGFGQAIYVGNTKFVSWVDLGTPALLALKYNIVGMSYQSIYQSIHWEGSYPNPGLVIQKNASDPRSFQALTAADTGNLSQIGSISAYIHPETEHIYIVRLCNVQICNYQQTESYYKFIALNNATPYAVRWNLFYTNWEYDYQEQDDEVTTAENTAKVALGFAATTFTIVMLALLHAIWQRHKARHIAVESPNVNTMATAYQAI